MRLDNHPAFYYDYLINKDYHAASSWSEKSRPNYERDDIPLPEHTVPLLELRTKLVKIALASDCIQEGAKIRNIEGLITTLGKVVDALESTSPQSLSLLEKIRDITACTKLALLTIALFEQVYHSPDPQFQDSEVEQNLEKFIARTRDLLVSRKYFNLAVSSEIAAYGNHRERLGVLGILEIEAALERIHLKSLKEAQTAQQNNSAFSELSSKLVSRYKKLAKESNPIELAS